MNIKYLTIVLVVTAIIFSSCSNNLDKEEQEIETYINDNNITVKPTQSGLYYIQTEEGGGKAPKIGAYVSVHYEGRFLNGEVFDSSIGKSPIGFNLGANEVIRGWEEGIILMKEGGKAQLVIPSSIAYGYYGSGEIEGYTPLVFDVELVEVKNP